MLKMAVAFAVALLTGCTHGSTPLAAGDSESQVAAGDAVAVFVDSWNRAASGDSQGPVRYGTLYWPDAELVDPSGNIWQGQPAIVQMHVDLWSSAFKGSVVKGSVRNSRRLSPTLMIADFDLELALAGASSAGPAPSGTIKAYLKHVMEKRGGEWKAISAQNTFRGGSPPAR